MDFQSAFGPEDFESSEGKLKAVFSLPEGAPDAALECARSASRMTWLRHMAQRFCHQLPAFVKFAQQKQGSPGGPPAGRTAQEIENDLTVELVTTSMMGVIIAIREELESAGLGIFRPKGQTVEPVDFSELDTNQIDDILGMQRAPKPDNVIQDALQDALDNIKRQLGWNDGPMMMPPPPPISMDIPLTEDEIDEVVDGLNDIADGECSCGECGEEE